MDDERGLLRSPDPPDMGFESENDTSNNAGSLEIYALGSDIKHRLDVVCADIVNPS
ncbi:unnamed protein product, partial [Ilex paraguariensis]